MLDAVFSFVVDADPKYVFQGFHLARSLITHTTTLKKRIFAQVTPEVDARTRSMFCELGCEVYQLERFGDGRYCNKLNQFEALRGLEYRYALLMDADMLVLRPLGKLLTGLRLRGRVVGEARPSRAALEALAQASGLATLPRPVVTDCTDGDTLEGNLNGGLYVIPRDLVEAMETAWKRWTTWLLERSELLAREGHAHHVDQVGLWLAIHHEALPWEVLPANWNYNPAKLHRSYDPTLPISIMHYHGTLNTGGQIDLPDAPEFNRNVIAAANAQIAASFDNRIFWDLRYRYFPERGSGLGSRAENIDYKRRLLLEQGIEDASGVLDVGCGDLEILRPLSLKGYFGIDQSPEAVRIAAAAKTDWQLAIMDILADYDRIPTKPFVICLEVLIHQKTLAQYRGLLRAVASKCEETLIISGFSTKIEMSSDAPSIFYHEPLAESLAALGLFSSIREIGRHTSVTIYRCDRQL
jgi:hypothetical protein